jgi:hypothetical protein
MDGRMEMKENGGPLSSFDAAHQPSRTTDHAPYIGRLECDGGHRQPFTTTTKSSPPKETFLQPGYRLLKGKTGLITVIRHQAPQSCGESAGHYGNMHRGAKRTSHRGIRREDWVEGRRIWGECKELGVGLGVMLCRADVL